jgi:hypothetical protein
MTLEACKDNLMVVVFKLIINAAVIMRWKMTTVIHFNIFRDKKTRKSKT